MRLARMLRLVSVTVLFSAVPAMAQMVPSSDQREIAVHANDLGAQDAAMIAPTGPFSEFAGTRGARAQVENTGYAVAYGYQLSQFSPGAISASGHTQGGWEYLSSADARLSFAPADLSPGADPLQFVARMWPNDGSNPWSQTLSTGNQTAPPAST